jgi:hypothetical protein
LYRHIIDTPTLAASLKASFDDLCAELQSINAEIVKSRKKVGLISLSEELFWKLTCPHAQVIPEIEYRDIANGSVDRELIQEVKKRGVAIVRGVVSENQVSSLLSTLRTF